MTSQSESESLMNHQLYDQDFRPRVIEAVKKNNGVHSATIADPAKFGHSRDRFEKVRSERVASEDLKSFE